MSDKKQFDRSKCFTFFESYYTTGQMIEEMKGKEVAYEYYKAIIEYASMDDLFMNIDQFYSSSEGRYTRTGTLRMSPESEFSGGGSVSSGEIRLNTGHRYSPSGRDTQTIYNYAEDGGLLGNGGFWSRTMDQVPRHIQESFGSRFS